MPVDRRGIHAAAILRQSQIKRHVKILGPASPVNPSWEEYFEKRDAMNMAQHTGGLCKLLTIWQHQEGRRHVCSKRITKETGWHLHHIVHRVDGGSDASSNLCHLHRACHRQGHSTGFKFVRLVEPEHPASRD